MLRRAASVPLPVHFYGTKDFSADEGVGWLMKQVTLSILQHADRRLQAQAITMAQWAPLFMLRCERARTVAELARELNADPGATTRLLDRLEKKGLCRRQRSTDDRRVVRVELTEEGRALADRVPSALASVLNDHLAGFTKTEWTALTDYLRRMVENGQSLKAAASAMPCSPR